MIDSIDLIFYLVSGPMSYGRLVTRTMYHNALFSIYCLAKTFTLIPLSPSIHS